MEQILYLLLCLSYLFKYMRYTLLVFNNYVGIVTDAIILKNLLIDADIVFLDNVNPTHKSEVGIYINNVGLIF